MGTEDSIATLSRNREKRGDLSGGISVRTDVGIAHAPDRLLECATHAGGERKTPEYCGYLGMERLMRNRISYRDKKYFFLYMGKRKLGKLLAEKVKGEELLLHGSVLGFCRKTASSLLCSERNHNINHVTVNECLLLV